MSRFGNRISRVLSETRSIFHQNPDFGWLFTGHFISRVGDQLYFVAVMWFVFELTGSTFFTGLAAAVAQLLGAFGFLFGPLVDRSALKKLLMGVEVIQGAIIALIPLAAYFQQLNVWVVLTVVALLGMTKQISSPAENTAIPRIVDDDSLVQANSLIRMSDNVVGTGAKAAAGIAISTLGVVTLFAINSVSFFVSAILYAPMRLSPAEEPNGSQEPTEYLTDIREGLSVVSDSVLAHVIFAEALASAFIGMTTAVLPGFADTRGGPELYGVLVGAMTLGMLAGSLAATRLESIQLSTINVVGFVISALCWFVAISVHAPLAIALMFGLAFVPVGVYNVLIEASIQSGVPESLLGRVSSIARSSLSIAGPTGLLLGGYLGEILNSGLIVLSCAVGFLFLSAYWILVPSLRNLPSITNIDADTLVNADGDG